MTTKQKNFLQDKFETMKNKIIDKLESGNKILWQMPYNLEKPKNIFSGHLYTGFNEIYLKFISKDFAFGTFKQWSEAGAKIRKGEKSFEIVYAENKTYKEVDKAGKETIKSFYILKLYYVFGASQVENIPANIQAKIDESKNKKNSPNQTAENFISNYRQMPVIEFNNSKIPSYAIQLDVISMPEIKNFKSTNEYYLTFFHEIIHSTGAKGRLERNLQTHNKSDYAIEELIAESGSFALAGLLNIDTEFKNGVEYIAGWTKAIKDFTIQELYSAFSKSSKAVQYIIDNTDNVFEK